MDTKELENHYPGLKEWSRDNFVGNECYSDEYRETQPAKGLGMIAELFEIYEAGTFQDEAADTMRLVEAWFHRMNNPQPEDYSYAGAEQLDPILARYHDRQWEYMGRHPYDHADGPGSYFDEDTLKWFHEDQSEASSG